MKTRVDDQLDYYESKAGWNKKWFYRLKIGEIIFSLFIPFLAAYTTIKGISLTVGLLGVIVAALAGIITLMRLQETWAQYRRTAESLKQEKFLYLAKAGGYKEDSSFESFVARVETILSEEHTKWMEVAKQEVTKPKGYNDEEKQ